MYTYAAVYTTLYNYMASVEVLMTRLEKHGNNRYINIYTTVFIGLLLHLKFSRLCNNQRLKLL